MRKIITAGENAILIYFGNKIDSQLPEKIAQSAQQLKHHLGSIIIDTIPSYTSLHISYDLNKIKHQHFVEKVAHVLKQQNNNKCSVEFKTICIPVYYDAEVALDLERLLLEKNLNKQKFVELHTARKYLVHAIGFSPAFAYLAEVDARIQAPRLSTPRINIPAGSVGIANNQSAVYPNNSSGGWNIIGRTPINLSLNKPDNIAKFSVGDRVKFIAITREEYLKSGGNLS